MFVIFEGLDKAGKTTLEWEFLKATNFKHMVIDRGPIGYMVFDEIFGRSTKVGNQNFIHYARKYLKSGDFVVIYCKAPYDIVKERLAAHNEMCPYDYAYAQKLYDTHINRYYTKERVIEIDTAKSINECVKQIIERFNEVCNEH